MNLRDVVLNLISERDIQKTTQNQYARSVECYSQFIGHPAEPGDLKESTVNQWLMSLANRGKAPRTIQGRKRGLTAVWNYAAELGIVDYYNPRRIRQIKTPDPVVSPWSTQTVSKLLEAADGIDGTLKKNAIPVGKFLKALVMLAYETGLRPGDLLRLKFSDVNFDALEIRIVQHKTGNMHVARITQETANAITAISTQDRGCVFKLSYNQMNRWVKRMIKAAGIRSLPREGLGKLRKTHGTEATRKYGLEAAARSLGHVSGTSVARRFYVSPDAVRAGVLLPAPRFGVISDEHEEDGDETRGELGMEERIPFRNSG